MKRKSLLISLAVIFQIGVVASMVVSREWLLATGKSYVFQTAPIDPRDIFRGDYVRLDYLFNSVPVSQLDEAILNRGLRKGEKVFLSLTTNSDGISSGGQLHSAAPQAPYLKGYVTSHWPNRYLNRKNEEEMRKAVLDAWPVTVKYGIEQYYVQQDSGKEMEKLRGKRNDFQVPLLIHAAVSESGEAGIRSYEWANIALKTEIVRSPERDAPDEKASAVMQLTVKNRGQRTLTLPLQEGNCSFTLIADGRRTPQDALNFATPRDCAGKAVKMVSLPPGESHVVTLDLNQPSWWVIYKDKPTPPGKLPWQYRYRIEYQGEPIEGLNAAILSSAFHGRGNVD